MPGLEVALNEGGKLFSFPDTSAAARTRIRKRSIQLGPFLALLLVRHTAETPEHLARGVTQVPNCSSSCSSGGPVPVSILTLCSLAAGASCGTQFPGTLAKGVSCCPVGWDTLH